jgi:hypothetical protein
VDWGEQVVRSATLTGLVAVLIGWQQSVAAAPVGVVTILEGDAVLIRGLSKFTPVEGMRIDANDLLETGKKAFLRIEFSDGAIVDFGPSSRAQLNLPSLRRADRAPLYLLAGWLKLSADKVAGRKGAVSSRSFDVLGVSGQAVERAEPGNGAVFAEQGPVRVMDRRHGAAMLIALESGDFLALRGTEAARLERQPPRDFVAALPRAFEDRLPSRIALFRDGKVAVKPSGTFTYAEVEEWIDAETFIRWRFVHDWVAKADEEAFRDRLEAGLARHPEWEPVLHPERFEPASATPVAPTPTPTPTPAPTAPSP